MDPAPALPTPDPVTGWGRAHWEAVADHLVNGILRHRSPHGALLRPPGRTSWSGEVSDGLEGYARSFLLASFRLAGSAGDDPHDWLPRYAEGLAAGLAAEPWPPIVDRGQPLVEAASLVVGLRLTREWLWDRLADDVRQRAVEWLSGAVRAQPVDNNWWLFSVLVADFLESVGAGSRAGADLVERGLARVESFHVGGGWYSDGPNRSFDYYNGWAMHFYLGLRGYLFGKADAGHLARLRTFLADHREFFDHDGGMIHFGRSLTYRVASVAPLWLGTLLDATPCTPGETRRIASATLRHFVERGAIRDGVWTAGWHGPHEPTLQAYSGSASPYWAAKGFLGLVLPADHPVWTEPEPEPAAGESVRPVAAPGFLLHRAAHDGTARLVNHGSAGHAGDPLYDRIAYSSRTGPTAGPADNAFEVWADGWRGRAHLSPLGTGPDWAASRHVPAPGLVVDAVSIVRGASEIRVHRVSERARVRHSGWALTCPHVIVSGNAVTTRADGLTADLVGLLGYSTASASTAPDGTAFGAPAAVPALEGEGGLFVCRVALRAGDSLRANAVRVGGGVRVVWEDGIAHDVVFDDLVVQRSGS